MKYRKTKRICREIIAMNAPNDHKALAYYWMGSLDSKFLTEKKGIESLNTALDYAEKESTRKRVQNRLDTIQKTEKRISLKARPKLEAEERILLRANSKKVSDVYVANMIKEYNFYDGEMNESGYYASDFVDNGDGTLTDRRTGLMWEKGGCSKSRSLRRAKLYVKEINQNRFAGHSDWRLPTIEELASLLESHKTNGRHIDPLFDKKQAKCWSSDKGPKFGGESFTPPQAWYVNFSKGEIRLQVVTPSDGEYGKYPSHIYVRAVRSLR